MTRRTESEGKQRWWTQPHLRAEGRVIGGVAGGVADAIDVDPLIVRVSFVVLLVAGGWGAVIYVGLWTYLAVVHRGEPAPDPTADRNPGTEADHLLAVGLIMSGLLLFFRSLGIGFVDSLVWPVALLALGLIVTVARTGVGLARLSGLAGTERSRGAVFARIAAGIVLAVGGIVALLAFNVDLGAARDIVIATSVIAGGFALVIGPWLWRMIDDMGEERRRRIRSEERSELAAQLHDSVLQTLSLIQRNSEDPATMVQLARGQERELRLWLYGKGPVDTQDRLASGLEAIAGEVEENHRIPIEVVVVGDVPADDRTAGLLAAAREAMLNASRHSGAEKIDVYAEVVQNDIQVFIRDTGVGFDVDAVSDDRRGLADSIRGRLLRLGGQAHIHSTPGEGTEVELTLPRRESRTERL